MAILMRPSERSTSNGDSSLTISILTVLYMPGSVMYIYQMLSGGGPYNSIHFQNVRYV